MFWKKCTVKVLPAPEPAFAQSRPLLNPLRPCQLYGRGGSAAEAHRGRWSGAGGGNRDVEGDHLRRAAIHSRGHKA